MRIGLIGAGAIAPLHALAATELPGISMTAVCDLAADSAGAVAATLGAATFTHHRELLDSGLVDAVIVNTPHALHRQMVEDAAACGLHVLVEKPMATTLEDCDAMVAACARSGVVLAVGHVQHSMAEKMAVADAIASGELGTVRAVHDLRGTDYRPGTRPDWFFSPSMAGGGALLNVGAHSIDRSVWLGGAPAVSVTAATPQRFGVDVETDGVLHLRLANDVAVSIAVLSGLPTHIDQVTVVCDGGVLVADPVRGAQLRVDGHTTTLLEPAPDAIEAAFRRQLEDFVRAVGGKPPTVSSEHARHVVDVVLTAYRSASEGGRTCVVGSRTPRLSAGRV